MTTELIEITFEGTFVATAEIPKDLPIENVENYLKENGFSVKAWDLKCIDPIEEN